MKDKYIKPELNVLMNIVIGTDQEKENDDQNGISFFNNNDISGGTTPGQGGSDL